MILYNESLEYKEGHILVKLIENIKELYTGEDILNKHICIACISGITGLLSDQDLLKSLIAQNNTFMIIVALIIALVGGLYLFGYTIETVHYRLQAGITVLPEINTQPFTRILGMALIMIVWIVYASIFAALIFTVSFLLVAGIKILTLLLVLLYALFVLSISYVFVAYAKDFKSFGLFNFTLPFKFMKEAFADSLILIVQFVILSILLSIPLLAVYFLLAFINKNLGMGIAICIGSYISFIIQLLWYNSLAEIYEEKLQDEVEELY